MLVQGGEDEAHLHCEAHSCDDEVMLVQGGEDEAHRHCEAHACRMITPGTVLAQTPLLGYHCMGSDTKSMLDGYFLDCPSFGPYYSTIIA